MIVAIAEIKCIAITKTAQRHRQTFLVTVEP
jgi:hypothetical protein